MDSLQEQNKNYHYAGFWIRALALLLDGLIVFIPSIFMSWVIPAVGGILVSILYKPFFESSALQATPGKALLGIKVITLDGGRISFKQSFIRYASSLLSSALLMIGYIMAAFSDKKQTLHDQIADTFVIYEKPIIGNYLNIWLDEIQRVFGIGEYKKTIDVTPTPTPSSDISIKLQELHSLFEKGILTEEEYKNKKEELLKRI